MSSWTLPLVKVPPSIKTNPGAVSCSLKVLKLSIFQPVPLETELLGPFSFHLTTNRGDDPAYSIGEYLNLMIRLDRDAWVYCFYQQSDASLVQIFPNPEMISQEPRLAGDLLHTIPGETSFPFKLRLTEPAGYEAL